VTSTASIQKIKMHMHIVDNAKDPCYHDIYNFIFPI